MIKSLTDLFLSSFVQPEKLIIKRWKGPINGSHRQLVLFAHFDPQGRIAPYVLYFIQCLSRLKADVVFISTAPHLESHEVEKVLPYCLEVIHRKNITLDFGSWHTGLAHTGLGSLAGDQMNLVYDTLIFTNDSVYGPLFPLEEVFETMGKRNLDFWGMTQNQEITQHLQSYFLVFNKKAICSLAFKAFWKNFRYYRSKRRIIRNYELGLSSLAKRAGWCVGTYVGLNEGIHDGLNPTLYHWDTLIEKFHFPFLKTEVLRLNRTHSTRIGEWKKILLQHTRYDPQLIEEDLHFFMHRSQPSDCHQSPLI